MNVDSNPSQQGSADFTSFLSNLADSQAVTMLQGNALYNSYQPTLSTFPAFQTGNDFFGPNRGKPEETTWGAKFYSALYLENLTGRAVFGISSAINEAVIGDELSSIPLLLPDGTVKRDYTVDEYMRVNEDYFKNLSGGDEILKRYSLGWYNGMKPSQFIAAMGTDALRGELRRDLNASTGSGFGDFTAVLAGSLPDPVSFYAGNALLKGTKLAVAAARGDAAVAAVKAAQAARVAVAAGKAAPVSLARATGQALARAIPEGIAQNTARSVGLTAFDPNDHTFQEYVDNLAFGFAIDAARSFGVSALKYAFFRMNPEAYGKLAAKLQKAEVEAKARIDKAADEAMPDEVIQAAVDMTKAAEQNKAVATAKQGQLNLFEEGQSLPPETKPTPKSTAATEAQPGLFDAQPVGEAKPPATPKEKPVAEARPTAATKVEGLTEQEKATILKIAAEQAKVTEHPIDDKAAAEQLDKIANRKNQFFNYGRLDAMGLRKVKIDQPILNAFFEKVVPPEGFRLDQLLSELKKAPLEVQLAAINEAGLKEALSIFEKMTKDPATAAATVLELAGKLGDEGESRVLIPVGAKIRQGTFEGVNIKGVEDYIPDRSNDFFLNTWNKLRKVFGLQEVSSVGGTVGAKLQAWFGNAIKFELSDNPLDRAIFDVYSAGTAGIAMKGETGGTLKPMAPFETTKRFYRTKAELAIEVGLKQPFKALIANNSVFDKIKEAVSSGILVDATERNLWAAYNEMVERLRLSRLRLKSRAEGSLFPREKDFFLADSQILDIYRDELFPGMNDGQARQSFDNLVRQLDDNGLLSLGINNNKKLSTWMNVTESNILGEVTAVSLGKQLTIEQLDRIFVKLFNLDGEGGKATTEVDPTFPYKGLARFAQASFQDAETGLKITQRFGPVTIDEIKAAIRTSQTQDIVNRLVDHFNDNWGGLAHAKLIEPLLQEFGRDAVRVSSENYIRNSSRFLAKLALAKNMYQRLTEFHVIENQRFNDPASNVELPLDTQIEFYQKLVSTLADSSGEGANPTAQAFRFFTEFNEQALDALIEYNKNVSTPRLASVAEVDNWKRRTEDLANYMKARLGLLPAGASNNWVDAGLASSQALILHGAGINMFAEAAKSMANGLTLPMSDSLGNYSKALLLNLKRLAVSKENAGLLLESMTTLQEDVGHLIARLQQEADGPEGFRVEQTASGETAKGVASAWRKAIGVASLTELGTTMTKRLGFWQEYNAHTQGPNSLVHLSSKIVAKVREGMTPLDATNAVAKETRLGPVASDNLFYHYSVMANYFSFDEMQALSRMFEKMDTKETPFKPAETLDLSTVQELGKLARKMGAGTDDYLLKTRQHPNMRGLLGSVFAPDDLTGVADFGPNFRDKLLAGLLYNNDISLSGVGPGGKVIDFFKQIGGIGTDINPADLLRKFGRYMDYAIEQKNMNIPTALSDYARMDTKSLPFKLLTMFVRTSTAQVINTTWGMANRGILSRMAFTVWLAGIGASIVVLKRFLAGSEDKILEDLDDKVVRAKMFNDVLDYGGFAPVMLSRPSKALLNMLSPNAFDRQNALDEFLPAPLTAAGGVAQAGIGLYNLTTGEELTNAQKRWIRKLGTANFLDTTVFRTPLNVTKHLTEDGSNAHEWIDFLYQAPRNK